MADEADDLDYSESNVGLAQAQGVRKNISLKLKGKGRGRGRRGGKVRRGSSKKVSGAAEDETEEAIEEAEEVATEKQLADSNLDDVISKLETPAFSPMDRTFPEPLHQNKKLRWDHKVNLIGEKVIDPLIHCCEKCSLPILNYGRMIPCKHVFCYDCAKKSEKVCPKCDEKIQRTEPSSLGTVFMCTFGGTRHSPGSCGRTYLSQRDLQAHINHRHMKPSSANPSVSVPSTQSGHVSRDPRDPRSSHLPQEPPAHLLVGGHLQQQQDHPRDVDRSPASSRSSQPYSSPASYPSAIPVSSARPNLITVPIQDDGGGTHVTPPVHHVAPPPHPMPPPHPGPAPGPYGTTPYPPPQQQPQPSSAYSSQAPPITTLTFSQPPPPVHHGGPPQALGAYSTPPPVHHGATPYGAAPPPGPPRAPHGAPPPRQQPMHPPPPPPQRFHEEGAAAYMAPQWGGGAGVPPPPTRASLPPRPLAAPPSASNPNVGLLTPRGPADNAYRQPYYQ